MSGLVASNERDGVTLQRLEGSHSVATFHVNAEELEWLYEWLGARIRRTTKRIRVPSKTFREDPTKFIMMASRYPVDVTDDTGTVQMTISSPKGL